jgi:hypothetical protein
VDETTPAGTHLEAMEARAHALCRTATPRRRPGSGGDNRRQPTWPLAAQQQPRAGPCIPQRLPRRTRPAFPRAPPTAQSAEPPCTDPYARWCGRGGAVRLPPIPIAQFRTHAVQQTVKSAFCDGDHNAIAAVAVISHPRCSPRNSEALNSRHSPHHHGQGERP